MSWKDFLNPDWRKMVLFFLLSCFFISVFWGLFYTSSIIRFFAYPFSHIYDIFVNSEFASQHFIIAKLLSTTLLTIDRFYYYLLSCLIIWIYNKRKKK